MPLPIAYLTMQDLGGFFAYDQLTYEPLRRLGWDVVEVPWNDEAVTWDDYTAVIIRSPWDYQDHADEFLSVLERIEGSKALLLNSIEVVRWNIRKSYLRDLEERGVVIVPTVWCDLLDAVQLDGAFERLQADEIVVKPIVGANADDTFRLRPGSDHAATRSRILSTFDAREAMIQPFLRSINDPGEFSLFYFAGEYSHAILKVPAAGDFRVQEEHGGQLHAVTPTRSLRSAGDRAMAAFEFDTLYARVDLVLLPNGAPAVIEVELIEPSLYFQLDEQSPHRFATALDRLLRRA